jgi:hypothetical protein
MKLEFIAEGAPDCPLIRVFGFSNREFRRLRDACADLAEGRRAEYPLHGQPWVEPIHACRLTLRIGGADAGVSVVAGGVFELWYDEEAWHEVRAKLEALMASSDGYQWLTDAAEGGIDVLVSRDGKW